MKFGTLELLIILAIILLIFGPSQLPKLAKIFRKNKDNPDTDDRHRGSVYTEENSFDAWVNENRDSFKSFSRKQRLRELLYRLAICIFCLVILFLIALFFSQNIIDFLTETAAANGYEFAAVTPQELLKQQYAIALAISVCVSFPIIIYHIWAFSQPELKQHKKMIFLTVILSDLVCFVIGILFTYKIILPFMLNLLVNTAA